jgi:hypothetical protein
MLRLLEKLRKNKTMYRLLLFSVYLILGACSDSSTPVGLNTDESGEISVTIKLSKKAAASLSRAEVVISAANMNEIRQNLTISGDTVTGTVREIPAGSNRLFTLNGYDSSGNLLYSGSATANVIAGQEVTVRITIKPISLSTGQPELRILPRTSANRMNSATIITFEIENTGTADATNVIVNFRARNELGGAITDATATVGTIKVGESKLSTARFDGADSSYWDSRYVTSADYTISYSEGEDIEGTVAVN